MTSVKQVNAVLKKMGRAERIRRGRGYYYYFGGNTHTWYSSSLPVCWLDNITTDEVLDELNFLGKDDETFKPIDLKKVVDTKPQV